jgi:RND family efflux transporter MFP subunit
VIEIPVQIGATITQSVPIARVSKTYDVQIHTFVPEKYISKMQYGLDAVLSFAAYPEETFRARIVEMSPVVDPQSRTLEVKMNLLTYDRRIKPGMFAEVKIITEKKDTIVKLPVDCLIQRYGVYYTFVIGDDMSVDRRKVTPGIQIDNKVEIVEGLRPNENVVIRGQTLLTDGSKVKIIKQVPPLEAQDTVE